MRYSGKACCTRADFLQLLRHNPHSGSQQEIPFSPQRTRTIYDVSHSLGMRPAIGLYKRCV